MDPTENENNLARGKLRVLVVEDEHTSREFLVELINSSGLAAVVGAVANVEDASELLVGPHGIDVAFVDIRLFGSEGDGLSLVRSFAHRAGAPLFVLATALHEHAVEAFELGVIDYVTKPFSRMRVLHCLQRLVPRVPLRPTQVPDRIVARKRDGLVFLSTQDVWCAESANRLVQVHCEHGVFDVDLSLAAIESAFAGKFIRVHRNWLVNTAHIRELGRETGEVTLLVGSGYRGEDPGIRVPVARDRAQGLRDMLLGMSLGVRRR
jgi:two-component system, LytTR family, response regulator LytT